MTKNDFNKMYSDVWNEIKREEKILAKPNGRQRLEKRNARLMKRDMRSYAARCRINMLAESAAALFVIGIILIFLPIVLLVAFLFLFL